MAHIILVDTTANHFTESVKYNQFQGFDFDTIDEVMHE